MSERTSTARRVIIGIPFLILYALFLFPAVFAVSIVLGAIDALARLFLGRKTRLVDWSSRLWDWNGSNARVALTGRGDYELLP